MTTGLRKSRPEQVFAVPAARQDTPELRGLVPAYDLPTTSSGSARGRSDDTIALTCGADVNLNGLHVVTIAWSDAAAGSIIDFSFVPFATEGRPAATREARLS